MVRKRLLVVSAVNPFPRMTGQQQRVFFTLKALRKNFEICFLGLSDSGGCEEVDAELGELCDEVILLPRRYAGGWSVRAIFLKIAAVVFSLFSGLRTSNFLIGRLELSPNRVGQAIGNRDFEAVLFEYWHAHAVVKQFNDKGVPCILDMHNVLWRSWAARLERRTWAPRLWKRWAVGRYREREKVGWAAFDALVAINSAERDEVKAELPDHKVFFAPMGLDLEDWSYSWNPEKPGRVAYYGGLGNPARQRDALWAYRRIMPLVWEKAPNAEFWFVGSNPPDSIRRIQDDDSRVRVTGYLEEVQPILSKISVLLCPWSGTFGFRSRLVEAMALGVPVVASPDAAWGMDLEAGRGIFFETTDQAMADGVVRLLSDPRFASEQSRIARHEMESKYGFEVTYGKLAQDMEELVEESGRVPSEGEID